MFDLIFILLMALYCWLGSKVDEWIAISALGFPLYTSEGFLRNPKAYHRNRTVILLVACLSLALTTVIPWHIGLSILVIAWLGTTWLGQRRAFNTYRQICYEGMLEPDDENQKRFFEDELKKTNIELRNIILHKRRF